jgi:hypothetical protein
MPLCAYVNGARIVSVMQKETRIVPRIVFFSLLNEHVLFVYDVNTKTENLVIYEYERV